MTDETQAEPLAGWIERIAQRREESGQWLNAGIYELQAQCRDEFARRRGWIVGKAFSIGQLHRGTSPYRMDEKPAHIYDRHIYDHVNYYRMPKTGKPVALITHSYAPKAWVVEALQRDGLAAQWLAESWYYPGLCAAALIQGGAGLIYPVQ